MESALSTLIENRIIDASVVFNNGKEFECLYQLYGGGLDENSFRDLLRHKIVRKFEYKMTSPEKDFTKIAEEYRFDINDMDMNDSEVQRFCLCLTENIKSIYNLTCTDIKVTNFALQAIHEENVIRCEVDLDGVDGTLFYQMKRKADGSYKCKLINGIWFEPR